MTTWSMEARKGRDEVAIATNSPDMDVMVEASRGGYVQTILRMTPRLALAVRDLIELEFARRKIMEEQAARSDEHREKIEEEG